MGDHNNYVLSQAPVLHLPAAPVLGGALPIPQHSQGSVPPTRLTTSQTSMYVLG